MVFWSAARLLLISFFCKTMYVSSCSSGGCGVSSWSPYLWLLSLLEEGLLAGLVLGGIASEVCGLRDLVDLGLVDTGKVDLLGGGDDVSGVDASQGDTVDLEGAGDEENTLVEGLEEHDALASESTSQQDENGTRGEGVPGSPGAKGLADLQ